MKTVSTWASAVILIGLVAGCSSDDDDGGSLTADAATPSPDAAAPASDAAPVPDARPPAPDATPVPTVNINVTVEYAGKLEGDSVIVAAFSSWPPSGPPLAFAITADGAIPQTAVLTDIEPGTYHFFAALDVPPANPMTGPEDPQAPSDAVVVDGTADVDVTITLAEPETTE